MSQDKDLLSDEPKGDSRLPPLMRRFELWTVLFFLFSLVYHLFFRLVFHLHGHMVFPFSLNSHDRFLDFTVFTDKFHAYHTAAFFSTGLPILYPSPVWVGFNFFFKYTTPHEVLAWVTFIVLTLVIPAILFGRALIRRNIALRQAVIFVTILCLLSWPADLIVDGANAEVFVWLTMVIAMWAYATERMWIAAVFIGIAASLKLFPFIFLTLFLSRRHIGKLLAGAGTFFAVTLWSLEFTGPTFAIALQGYLGGLAWARTTYFAKWQVGEQGVDHSLFATIKLLILAVTHPAPYHGHPVDFSLSLHYYTIATAIAGLLLYFLRIRFMPLLNQVLTLSIICIYFTPFSGDGTLIHLYYPLAMLFLLAIQAYRDQVTIPGMPIIMYCMVVCLSMESFLVVPFKEQGVRFIGPAHCVALGIMLVAALRYRLGPPLTEDRGEIVLSQPVTGWVKRTPASS